MRPIVIVNFGRYNPASRELTSTKRDGMPLLWVRWNTDTHRDQAILDLPKAERWLWPTLIGLAGKGSPRGTVAMTPAQLAREADLTEDEVRHALKHLRVTGRIDAATDGVATS